MVSQIEVNSCRTDVRRRGKKRAATFRSIRVRSAPPIKMNAPMNSQTSGCANGANISLAGAMPIKTPAAGAATAVIDWNFFMTRDCLAGARADRSAGR